MPKAFPENSEGRIQHVKRSAIFEFDVAAGTYRAGVTLDGQLRGEHLTKYLLFTAAGNYQVVYALPEVDSEFTNDMVLVATSVDGKPLPNGEGPFRLVNQTDKKPARWIRELKSIKVQVARD